MNNKIINVNDESYIVLGKVSADSQYSTEELKSHWRLADTILKNQNEFFICMKIIDVKFNDI
ncbi:hypothetical protein HOE22_00530 [Candidatus Woesearchaeota archaeon]|jgi:hypothetical protein|nr:hypothetical protein [Candidatus Woesearchaeota archaeon]MBT7556787.1 hypothetical protein [Candidatus Woesearchaeota archaeon]|tara:strand:+ start:415 stop:600 length:186 start_codon:yes stop_codon:yes gene_type:complete